MSPKERRAEKRKRCGNTYMDPAIIIFGFGIGALIGMTGMGGGTLMTPLLIIFHGTPPVTAIGTDIFYAAVTKTVGGWRHWKMKTVNMGLVFWLAAGSVPSSILGVWVISMLKARIPEESLNSIIYALLGGTLLMVGIITLARALILTDLIDERDDFEIKRRHKVAAVTIGVTTGFIIGITSAGSGTVIAILLIAVFRLSPKRVVGTDVFHAAVLLWAAGMAHWVSGHVDFVLAGNILLGSVPGVVIGAQFSRQAPVGFIRTALGVVLVASGALTAQRGAPLLWPFAALIAGLGLLALIQAPKWMAKRRQRDLAREQAERERRQAETPVGIPPAPSGETDALAPGP